jgi:hypothetical protein
MTQVAQVSGGNPPRSSLDEELVLKPEDPEEIQAVKLKYQASIDAQVVQGCINSCRVVQDGARGVGVAA